MQITFRSAGQQVQTASCVDDSLAKHQCHGRRALQDPVERDRALGAGALIGLVDRQQADALLRQGSDQSRCVLLRTGQPVEVDDAGARERSPGGNARKAGTRS